MRFIAGIDLESHIMMKFAYHSASVRRSVVWSRKNRLEMNPELAKR